MAETLVPEMVERVARAISGAPFPSPASYRKARAAIEAMREPTQVMLEAARDWSAWKYGKPIGNDAAIGCWTVMLDMELSRSST